MQCFFFFYLQCSVNAVSSMLVQTAFYTMCRSRKYPYSPPDRTGISWGAGGSVRPKNFKKCMKLCWNFQRGWGGGRVLEKIPSVGKVCIFYGTTQYIDLLIH